MARLGIRWKEWRELILAREAWEAFWRVSNARQGRYRNADMVALVLRRELESCEL
jgi:hypothetical protein